MTVQWCGSESIITPAEVTTCDWSNSTMAPKMEKWRKCENSCNSSSQLPGVENLFSPFSNSNSCTPACGGAAQGQKMGKRSENHPICVKLAENHQICVQWQTVSDFLRTLTCARTDLGWTCSNTSLNFSSIPVFVQNMKLAGNLF